MPEETPVQPRTIFEKIFYSDPQEQSEIHRLIIGFAIAGVICGHMWGGFYDPWRNRGLAAALLNLFLFGGWGLVQSVAMLVAWNLELAKSRKMLIFIAALCGGVWVSIFTTLDLAKDLIKWEPVFFRSVVGLIAGFITGAGISAISVIKLSRIISAGAFPKSRSDLERSTLQP